MNHLVFVLAGHMITTGAVIGHDLLHRRNVHFLTDRMHIRHNEQR